MIKIKKCIKSRDTVHLRVFAAVAVDVISVGAGDVHAYAAFVVDMCCHYSHV